MALNDYSESPPVDVETLLGAHDLTLSGITLRRSEAHARDGDGTMLGRVLIYAGIMVACAAIILLRRVG